MLQVEVPSPPPPQGPKRVESATITEELQPVLASPLHRPPHSFLPFLPELVANFPSSGITIVPQISVYKCSRREIAVDIYRIFKKREWDFTGFIKHQYNTFESSRTFIQLLVTVYRSSSTNETEIGAHQWQKLLKANRSVCIDAGSP